MRLTGNLVSIVFVIVLMLFHACKPAEERPAAFEILEKGRTGLDFNNKLTSTEHLNLFKYMYFYNGSGIGAGDFNNDGKTDIFFGSNQGANKIYLNKGGLQFKDVTRDAKLTNDSGWSTGISIVDINNDGMLDIYVCRVGKHETLHSHNQLWICQGINTEGVPFYAEKATEYGVAFSGFSTQAAFFDYDGDGDLDMYLLNHSLHQNANFDQRLPLLVQTSPLSGDRLYRNNGNETFTDVTHAAGINSSVIGYGLGLVVADINMDGLPDVYVGNDFHENDYLYINLGNGTFKEDLTNEIMHTSQYTMGVDVADVSNDGYPEIISMDMLPGDPTILKRSLGQGDYDVFSMKLGYGYNYQYSRNNLQFNRRNGRFSETGLYSGIAATDWSWAPLFFDFDNDGLKDLFISNGIPKRMNDIDYINYISNDDMQKMIQGNKMNETNMALIDKFPKIKIPNRLYKNMGQMRFADIAADIRNDQSTFSNGAAYADLDDDGDLDIVVNNIDEYAMIYENKSALRDVDDFLEVRLTGPANNRFAIGAKAIVFAGGEIRTYEKFPVRGFQSSMETPIHIGLHNTRVDSIILVWPDNHYQRISKQEKGATISLSYTAGLPLFDYRSVSQAMPLKATQMVDVSKSNGFQYAHKENAFVEFDREPLIPHMVSREGPALAVGDVNGDGLDDIFIGSAKGYKSVVSMQDKQGHFNVISQPALELDSMFEDTDACWVDVNNDGLQDLVVASGGNEYYGQDEHMLPRVYLNNASHKLQRLANAIPNVFVTASCVVANDFNGDGFIDLFIGGRAVPSAYGETPRSYLLQNDGHGMFRDVTSQLAPELSKLGFVTGAAWCDLDNNGTKELMTSCEWGGIDAFINSNGVFRKKILTDKKGWWNFVYPVDINQDGRMDLVAGNLGLNSRLKASPQEPVGLYYDDFDGNGKKEQVLTYFVQGRELPFASKAEVEKQMPVLRKKFLLAENFAKASLEDLLTAEKVKKAIKLQADYFSNAVLMNQGSFSFELKALPWQAQLSSYRDASVIFANSDSLPDLLIAGNYYDNNVEMGRYDADGGTVLLNMGKGSFDVEPLHGAAIKGEVRHIKSIALADRTKAFILARNNDSSVMLKPVDDAPIRKPAGK